MFKSLLQFLPLTLFGLFLVGIVSIAFADTRPASSDSPETRTKVHSLVLAVPAFADAGTDLTPGQNGVVAAHNMRADGGTAFDGGYDGGTVQNISVVTIKPPPYPCRLNIRALDNDGNETLACGGTATIKGYDQFGNVRTETHAGLSETPWKTNYAYESVSSVTAVGCPSTADANDYLRVSCSLDVGLPTKIGATSAIKSVELYSGSIIYAYPYGQATISPYYHTVALDSITGTPTAPTLANGDRAVIRVRPPAGY